MEATGITHAIFSSDWAQPSWLDSFAYPKTRHRSQGNGLVGLDRPRPRLILETGSLDAAQPKISPSQFLC